MIDEILIVDATQEHILDWLRDLLVLARDEQRKNPLRPQFDPLVRVNAARLDAYQLPIYLRSRHKRVLAIYIGVRAGASPFVTLLVRVSVEKLYRRTLRLELECDPAFPFSQSEVRWHLLQRFPNYELSGTPAAPLPPDPLLLRPPRYRSHPDQAAELPPLERSGPPLLSCNEWLEEQLTQRADAEYCRILYRPWLERYRALRGYYPADPRRSFRAAVEGCLHRLEQGGRLPPPTRRSTGKKKR